MIELTENPIDVNKVFEDVRHPEAGGIDIFIGTVRNTTQNKKVVRLEFEAYEKMAIKEMEKIAENAREKWSVLELAIVHRLGSLEIGEIPVVIAVSTPHRADAFEACRFIIDTLKQTVPIWKKEIFEGGEIWVNAHP